MRNKHLYYLFGFLFLFYLSAGYATAYVSKTMEYEEFRARDEMCTRDHSIHHKFEPMCKEARIKVKATRPIFVEALHEVIYNDVLFKIPYNSLAMIMKGLSLVIDGLSITVIAIAILVLIAFIQFSFGKSKVKQIKKLPKFTWESFSETCKDPFHGVVIKDKKKV